MKNKRIKRNWGDEDLYILIWIISKYCDYKNLENLEKDIVKYNVYLGALGLEFYSFDYTRSHSGVLYVQMA